MGLFSMRNPKIRLIYYGEMRKIGKLKLSSAVEPFHWALRRRLLAEPSSYVLTSLNRQEMILIGQIENK